MITLKSLQGLPDELFKASLKQETIIRRYVASLQRKEILDLMMNLTVALKDSTEEDLPPTNRHVIMSIYLQCLEREWENGSTFEMEMQVEVWLKDVKAPQTDVYRFANRLAWITRWDRTLPPLADPLQISSDTDNSLDVSFVGRLYLNRARFAFTTNDSFVSSVENYEKKFAHPFILANRGFAEILAGRVRGVSSHLDDAWERRAEDNEIVDICLHALWLAADNAEMATKLSNWCEQAIAGGYANSIIYYRHARALRELEDFDLALMKINEAIRINTGTGEFFATFSEQLLREQQMIIMQRDFAAKLAIFSSSLL
jgi:tetratricopeptide (TPR) repeat protein